MDPLDIALGWTCKHILLSGPHKGQPCLAPSYKPAVAPGSYCKKHKHKYTNATNKPKVRELLDGAALVDKMDELHEDWTKWYAPSREELRVANWHAPSQPAKDTFSRRYDPVNDMYRGISGTTNRIYYYKETGGNMTRLEVSFIKANAIDTVMRTETYASFTGIPMSSINPTYY